MQLNPSKTETLRIRCTKDTLKRYKNLEIDHDFPNHEELLKALIRIAEQKPHLLENAKTEIRWG